MNQTPEPVQYMTRSRDYYAAQGFEKAYVWAQHDDVPFTLPDKPLSTSTLGVITTAALHERVPLEPRSVASAPMQTTRALYANDLSWDKQATHLDDLNSYFPIDHLNALVDEGRIGRLAPRLHCAPTEYSQRKTNTEDAPELLARCQADNVDVALLIPL